MNIVTNLCPKCGNLLYYNYENGLMYCGTCGYYGSNKEVSITYSDNTKERLDK